MCIVDTSRPYAAKVVMAAPEASGDAVQLMWLANSATGEVLGSKVVESAVSQGTGDGPATLVTNVREGYAGVARGTRVQPFVLYARDGLWAGEPFVLCEPGAGACTGALGVADLMLDTRGRRPRGEIGAELLRKAASAVPQ